MVYCSAPSCKNSCTKTYRFYRFPRDPQRRRIWARLIQKNGWEPKDTSRLCEVHFEESAFESHRADGLRKLKPNAVPTIHNFSQNKRKRRKQCVNPRVEFTFGESDSESLVLAEKLISNSNEGDPIQISEIYYSQLDDVDTPPSKRKKLKTIHVTEIVNSRAQEGSSENEAVESFQVYSAVEDGEVCNNKSHEKEAKDTPVVKGKRGRPFKKRRKRCNLMKDESNNPAKEIVNDLEKNKNNVELDQEDARPVFERVESTVECFVCNQIITSSSAVHLKVPTEATRILLVHRLETIADLEGVIGEQEVVCRRCASLLNHIDRTEAELSILKGAISACVRGRNIDGKAVSNPEFVNNLQLLDRFESITGGRHNILSLDELFFMKAEKEDSAEKRVKNVRDAEVLSDEGNVQEVFLEEDMKIETEDNVTDNERDECLQVSPVINDTKAAVCTELEIIENSSTSTDENRADEKTIEKEDTSISNTPLKKNSCQVETQSNVPDLGTQPKVHVCKICAFKTQHDSVMIWHLRMHMRNGRWCDFCSASIPEQESIFSRLKKSRVSYKSQRRKTGVKPMQPIMLPSVAVDPVNLPTFPLSSYPLTLIPIQNLTSSAPVLLISKESSDIKKVVGSSSALVNQPHNREVVPKLVTNCDLVDGNSDNARISGISLLPNKVVMPKVDVRISCAKEKQVQKQFFIQVNPSSKRVDETASIERFCGIQDSAAIRLEDAGSSVAIGEEFNESISNCDNLVGDSVMENYNSLQEQSDIVTNESVRGEFVDESSECIKPENLHSEVFCEGGVESSFLDTLSSQPTTKFEEILPEICDESTDQNVMTISNDTSEVNITNKDVSFARSDGLGESELAIAYENSVAALMCQSDDSETMLSYH